MEVTSLNYGAIITRILVPDKNGTIENIVLEFDSLDEYKQHSSNFGAVIGRCAGRIKNAQFELDGRIYQLSSNDNGNHLHGGLHGLDKVVWRTELPTGKILDVDDTPFDFRKGRVIIDGVLSYHPQNVLSGSGYDHFFILSENMNQEIVLSDEERGRILIVETDQPGVVLYTSNQLAHTFAIRGVPARKYLGVCLETQGCPDSLHHPHFPSNILEKGKTFHSVTTYRLEVNLIP